MRGRMAYDYDKLFADNRQALGAPSPEIVRFFEHTPLTGGRVLDVGCGQGRDALLIARRGHAVVGVDISPNGIRDLTAAAKAEGLDVDGVVADINAYTPVGGFEVVLIDRTLHMLPKAQRLAVLGRLMDSVDVGGWLLIVDEPSNMQSFKDKIAAHPGDWTTELSRRGYLFLRRG